MSNDSALFVDKAGISEQITNGTVLLPLYESKFIHQFNHRFATFTADADEGAQEISTINLTNALRFVHRNFEL